MLCTSVEVVKDLVAWKEVTGGPGYSGDYFFSLSTSVSDDHPLFVQYNISLLTPYF